jgi:hypothetical protein
MLNKATKLKKTVISTFAIFIIVATILFVWGVFFLRNYGCKSDIGCYIRFMQNVLFYYFTAYLIISFIYSACFYYLLKPYKIENLRKILRHLYMIAILFGSGMTLYAINTIGIDGRILISWNGGGIFYSVIFTF